MLNTMRNMILLLALASITSCVNFRGTFTANQKLKLVHTTIFGNEKTRTVPAGTYATRFKFSSEDKIKLTFENGDNDIEVKIKLPENRNFPRERGAINLPASKTGQKYDITGFIDTQYSYSDVRRERESCSYTVYRRECHTTCDNRGNCRQVCNRVPVTRYGYQHVEYRYRYTDRDLKLEMVAPGTDDILGEYRGDDRDVFKDYLHRGRCF